MRKGVALFVAFFIGILLVANSAPAAEMQTFKIRIHSQMPAGHFVTKAVDMFIVEATKQSKGTLQFTHYPSQQLFSDSQIPDVLPKGGVEMAQLNGSMFVGKIPEVGIGSIPATFDDLDHYYRYYYDFDRSKAVIAMEEGFEKKANIIILGTLLYTPNNVVVSTKPITRIEDFQGKKMRGWGKPLTLILQAWGGAGVVMSSGDVYMAMDRGTIDGVFSGMTSALSRKWYEVAKHVSIIRGFLPSPFNLGVNLDTWKKLHPDQKRAMIRAAHTAEVWCTKASIAEDDKAEKALVAKGVKVFVWPQDQAKKLRDLARPVIFEEQIRKPLGNEMVAKVEKWVEATRHSKMTWEQACQKNTERLLAKVK